MTARALARCVVVALRRVTRQAEASIGHQPRDRRFAMTGIARHVRVRRVRVRCPDPRTRMTPGAVAARVVVIVVAGRARFHRGPRVERDRRLVTAGAAELRVRRVGERDGPRARGPIRDRDGDRFGMHRRELGPGMARRALARCRVLMMTDLTTARRRERQPGIRARGDVTGETGELFVAIVRKGVNRSLEPGAGSRGCTGGVGVPFPSPFRLMEVDHGGSA